MSKVNIKRLDSVTKNDTTATEQINDNFKALQAAIENTVSRDGTVPNYMDADLDLNSYRIINVGNPVGERDVVTLKYFEDKVGGAVEAAAEAKANASKAASSAQSALVASNNAIGQIAKAEGLLIAAEGQLENTEQYVDAAKADIKSAVDQAEMNISNIVIDAEGSITNIAVTEANKAIANVAQEATDTAKANLNSYVDGTVKPSLQTYVDQAQEDANSAATSKEQAASSATAASNSASNASADADNAAESASQAANSATAAATSKTNAETSETNVKIWAEGTDAQVQALGGEKSAKGWAEASTNLDYTNITNCITKIPQDIKLELANGTLTLKAGSKVYVPNGKNANGSNKFDVVITQNDLSCTQSWNGTLAICYKNGKFTTYALKDTYSGTTPPNLGVFYNTSDNTIKRYVDGTVESSGYCFPLGIATSTGGKITSIDQVFNGFGYIGSTVFALPGVKGLIPNGRNTDGSLKNTEFTIDAVKIDTKQSDWTQEQEQFINASSLSGRSIGDHYYNEVNNYNKCNNGTIIPYCSWGSATLTAGRISNFTPKTAFHAVDYNDYAREVDNTVHKTGDETIEGVKKFTNNINVSNPSGVSIMQCNDPANTKNNAKIQYYNGDNSASFANVQNGSSIGGIKIDNSGYAYSLKPPVDTDKSTQLATTSWVRKYGAQINYAAGVTVSSGSKASISGLLVIIETSGGGFHNGNLKINSKEISNWTSLDGTKSTGAYLVKTGDKIEFTGVGKAVVYPFI